jgi:hypothetical protein
MLADSRRSICFEQSLVATSVLELNRQIPDHVQCRSFFCWPSFETVNQTKPLFDWNISAQPEAVTITAAKMARVRLPERGLLPAIPLKAMLIFEIELLKLH